MSSQPQPAPMLEGAYVLFMDIVAYSKLPMDEQRSVIAVLKDAVRSSEEFRRAEKRRHLLSLPTGDGMVLAFFGGPEAPLSCAIGITRTLRQHPEVKLRMGIHAGPVYRVEDINAARNVAGGGINKAQRVMDCGDTGHILVSAAAAEYLRQVSVWSDALHDIGEVVVKHGERIHLYNFYNDEAGNPALPAKLELVAKTRKRTQLLILAAVVIALVIGIASYRYFWGGFVARKTIAVLGLKNETGIPDLDWAGDQFSDDLTAELEGVGGLRVIPRDRVMQANKDLAIDVGMPLAMALPTLQKTLAVDFIVYGSYRDQDGMVNVDLHLKNAVNGVNIAQWSRRESEDRITQLADSVAKDIGKKCGVRDANPVALNDPKSREAKEHLEKGLSSLRNFDAGNAREILLSAARMEPGSPRIHSALADAWAALGNQNEAKAASQKALELASGLSKDEQERIEAKLAEASDEWDKATMHYGTLFERYPDDIDIGLRLTRAKINASEPKNAMEVIRQLRKLSSPSRDDPRIDLVEAEVDEILSKYEDMQRCAEAAIAKAGEQHMISARGEELKGIALGRLGHPQEAIDSIQKAGAMYTSGGNKLGAAKARLQVGKIKRHMGNLREAQRISEQSLDTFHKLGYQAGEVDSLNLLGLTLEEKGDLRGAKETYERGRRVAKSIAYRVALANLLGNLGNLLYEMGDLDGAENYHNTAIQEYLFLGDTEHRANELNNLGAVYHERGELDRSKMMCTQAIELVPHPRTKAFSLSAYGELLTDMGDLKEARRRHEEAVAIWKDIRDPLNEFYDRVALANLDLEEGKTNSVESVTRSAISRFRENEEFDRAILAETVLIRALLDQKRIADAQREVPLARAFIPKAHSPYGQYDLEIVAARVDAETGNTREALRKLRELTKKLNGKDYVRYQLKAKLLLDEIRLKVKKSDEVLADLSKVEEEAKNKGFGLIARKAAADLSAGDNGQR